MEIDDIDDMIMPKPVRHFKITYWQDYIGIGRLIDIHHEGEKDRKGQESFFWEEHDTSEFMQ